LTGRMTQHPSAWQQQAAIVSFTATNTG
jgi:hypothetical protein